MLIDVEFSEKKVVECRTDASKLVKNCTTQENIMEPSENFMDPFYMTILIICKFDNSLEPPGKFMDQVSDVNLLVSFEMGPRGIFKISHRVCKKLNEAHSS